MSAPIDEERQDRCRTCRTRYDPEHTDHNNGETSGRTCSAKCEAEYHATRGGVL